MTKQHDDMLRDKIRSALDPLAPDQAAKQRMYDEILDRARRPKQRPRPWYLRWQVSVGVGMTAMACVLVMVVSLHGRLPQNGSQQLEVVPPAAEQMTTKADVANTTTLPPQTTQDTQPMVTSTQPATTGMVTTGTVIQTSPGAGETWAGTTRPSSDRPQTTPAASTPAAVPQETAPAVTTDAAIQTTSPATVPATQPVQTEPSVTASSVTETAPSQETTPTQTTTNPVEDNSPPIRQNIYLYNMLTWNQIRYQTTYETVDGSALLYLGAGATDGKDVSDTYTVLVYAIQGMDQSEQLAVQYAGENCYYLFTPI